MTDLASLLAALRRPRLLMRAARFGLAEYRRTPAMRRLFAAAGAHSPAQVVALLLAREAEHESRRQAGDAGYSVARHVDLLIALMAESRLLRADTPSDALPAASRLPRAQPKASGIAALRRATNAASASCTAGSSAGAS